MKEKPTLKHILGKIPWNFLGQLVLACVFFYLLGWMVTRLSFTGSNKADPQADQAITALEIYDNFGFKVYDTKWNESTWSAVGTDANFAQRDGIMQVSRQGQGSGGLLAHRRQWLLTQINYAESRLMLNQVQAPSGEIGFEISTSADGNQPFIKCGIQGGQALTSPTILCTTASGFSTTSLPASYDTWYLLRFAVDPENGTISFFVDNQEIGTCLPPDFNTLKSAQYSLVLYASSSADDGTLAGSFDDIRLKNR